MVRLVSGLVPRIYGLGTQKVYLGNMRANADVRGARTFAQCVSLVNCCTCRRVFRGVVPYSIAGNFRDFREPRPKRENKNREIRNRENLNT